MKPHKSATFSLPQSRFARQLPRQREPRFSYCKTSTNPDCPTKSKQALHKLNFRAFAELVFLFSSINPSFRVLCFLQPP